MDFILSNTYYKEKEGIKMHVTMYKGVVFIDEDFLEKSFITEIAIESNKDILIKDLGGVREYLYQQVNLNNGNCLCNFKIGKRQTNEATDSFNFFGSGVICTLSDENYQKYVKMTEEEE